MDFKELESSVTKLNSAFEENTAKAINRNVTARNWLIGFYSKDLAIIDCQIAR